MSVSSDLILELVKATKGPEKQKTETTVYGTIKEYNNSNYVQLDGSELLTPISTTADTKDGERVTVMIKNHTAIVTGNISSPAARTEDVKTTQIIAEEVQADNVIVKKKLTANEAEFNEVKAQVLVVTESFSAVEADIENLKAKKLDAEVADLTYATIEDLEATDADINNLEATYAEFEVATTNKFGAIEAKIENLEVENFDAVYANIDFSNIGRAAIQQFFLVSGLIKDVVVGDQTVTGELVGVTIKGDLIEGNTIKADKLVIKGTDGLYYKLNTDGMVTEAEQTDENSLNGQIIQAKSITATKIDVKDLVAFDATIGGFKITEKAIHSSTKESVDNTTEGVYMDSNGQVAIGDAKNHIKYYIDADGNRRLVISADSLVLSSSEMDMQTVADDAQEAKNAADQTEARITVAESMIQQLSDAISMLVVDGSGASLMTQTPEGGWTFSTGELQDIVDGISESLGTLTNSVDDANSSIGILQQAVADLGVLSDYVKITTYENEPCIELGETDSDFKLLITNTRILFKEGASTPAYISNRALYIEKAIIKSELHQGGFVWKVRSNGNLGLMWKGASD